MNSILAFALGLFFGFLLSKQHTFRLAKRRKKSSDALLWSSKEISSWMNLTATQRSNADEEAKIKAARSREILINKIQEEFKEIKKNAGNINA